MLESEAMNYKPTLTKTYEAEGIKNLHLKNFSGNIELIGHEENNIKVEVFASVRSVFTLFILKDPLLEFDFDTHELSMNVLDNTLMISSKPDYFNVYNWFNFQTTSFRIYLPASINSYSKTYSGQVSLKKLEGNHTFSTWGGDISAEQTKGNIEGKTMGGKINLFQCEGRINASTMGGNIFMAANKADINIDTKGGNMYIQHHEGNIHCSSWGGNIEAFTVNGFLECNTAGGNIYLKNVNGNIGASTKGGNIKAEVNEINQYAWFDTAGGNIKIALPLEQPLDLEASATAIYTPIFSDFSGLKTEQSIRGKLNGGGPNVTIKTLAGKIDISNSIFTNTYQPNKPSTPKEDFQPNEEKKSPDFSERKTSVNTKPFDSNEKNFQFKPSYNLLFNIVFCLFLGYALTSIIFFSLELNTFLTFDFSEIYPDIFYLNLMSALASIAAIYVFLTFFESKIPIDAVKFLPLMGCSFLFSDIFHTAFSWRSIDESIWSVNFMVAFYFYFILPALISWAYLFYWLRTRSITRKISEQEYQLLNLEKLKSKAQLDALEARINPHFLYNSLNSIAGLIHDKPDKAEEMTIQLSKLFRYTTGRTEENFHTLADELEIIKAYLTIEEVRFGHRLTYSIDCEESILEEKIPRFLLQPLVENAIKHGISKIASAGIISVKISEAENNILIKIHDNGPDFGESFGGGFGLRSIKEKLKIVYGDKASIDIKNQPEKVVMILIMK